MGEKNISTVNPSIIKQNMKQLTIFKMLINGKGRGGGGENDYIFLK